MSPALPSLPGKRWPFRVRAPGKAILFGEHAVVRGRTALVLAVDRGTEIDFRPLPPGSRSTWNGAPFDAELNPYLREAMRRHPDWSARPVALTVRSELPRASGLGTSAAFTVALVAGFTLPDRQELPRAEVAEESYRIERAAQGVGSPVDTSASTAGGLLAIGTEPGEEELWTLPAVDTSPPFHARRVHSPPWSWAAAFSGIAKATGPKVRAVGEVFATPEGAEILERIGRLSREGEGALDREDKDAVGALMAENHQLLRSLGVSHPRLEALLEVARPFVHGAKVTGAGGGGSVLALVREGQHEALRKAWARAGGVPFLLSVAPQGLQVMTLGSALRDHADHVPGL